MAVPARFSSFSHRHDGDQELSQSELAIALGTASVLLISLLCLGFAGESAGSSVCSEDPTPAPTYIRYRTDQDQAIIAMAVEMLAISPEHFKALANLTNNLAALLDKPRAKDILAFLAAGFRWEYLYLEGNGSLGRFFDDTDIWETECTVAVDIGRTNKAGCYSVEITTPGGSKLLVSGCERGLLGMDPIDLAEKFSMAHPEYGEQFYDSGDHYTLPAYLEFEQSEHDRRMHSYEKAIKANPFQFMVTYHHGVNSIELKTQGTDFIDGGAATLPTFRP
jgi:hypothetical protein